MARRDTQAGRRTPNYVLVLLLVLAATGLTYWVRSKPVEVLFSADLEAFPRAIGPWNGQELEISSEIETALNVDSILSRRYANARDGAELDLLVEYRKYGRRDFSHRPEMCYPAAGWEITSKGLVSVPYGGRSVQAVRILARKDDREELIVYWFASGTRTEANFAKQQLWMALDRLRTQKYGWAFIRINTPIVGSEEEAAERIREFLASASGPLVQTLTGPRTALGTGLESAAVARRP